MARDKAAAAAKSSPEWRSRREQPRMEIMKLCFALLARPGDTGCGA